MNITVLTPDKEIFSGAVTSVKVPGVLGQFQVLKNHAPIVSSLEKGSVEIVTASGTHRIFDTETGVVKTYDTPGRKVSLNIGGGFNEVLNNEISLLVRAVTGKEK